MSKTLLFFSFQEKSKALSEHFSAQFVKLHQFLNDKEREVKKQLEEEEKQILNTMGVNMFTMEEMLSDGREKQGMVKSALEMNRPTQFLQVRNKYFYFLPITLLMRMHLIHCSMLVFLQWWGENGCFINRDVFLFKST